MSRHLYLSACSALALSLGLGLTSPAAAQGASGASRPSSQSAATDVEEVVVTGSLLKTTPEDAALPVDVITNEALKDQGSPSLVDLCAQFLPCRAGTSVSPTGFSEARRPVSPQSTSGVLA